MSGLSEDRNLPGKLFDDGKMRVSVSDDKNVVPFKQCTFWMSESALTVVI